MGNSINKKDIILDSYNVLKDDYPSNCDQLCDLITEMFKIDVDLGVEMWVYLLENYDSLDGSIWKQTGVLARRIPINLFDICGSAIASKIIYENKRLRKMLFRVSGEVHMDAMEHFIKTNELSKANDLIEDLYNNPNADFGERVYTLINYVSDYMSEPVIDFFVLWSQKAKNKEQKAKMNSALLKYL